jgi:hypothetical protein
MDGIAFTALGHGPFTTPIVSLPVPSLPDTCDLKSETGKASNRAHELRNDQADFSIILEAYVERCSIQNAGLWSQ